MAVVRPTAVDERQRYKTMNKIFALILFLIGVALVLAAACANPMADYVLPGASMLDTWGIIWRIGLGLLLIILAVLLGNMETLGKSKADDFYSVFTTASV